MTVEGQVTVTTEDSVTVEDLVLVDDLVTVEDQGPVEVGIVALWVGATCCPAWQECFAGRHELAKCRLMQVAAEGCEYGAAPPHRKVGPTNVQKGL